MRTKHAAPARRVLVTVVALTMMTSCAGSSDKADSSTSSGKPQPQEDYQPGGTIRRASIEPDAIDPQLVDETEGAAVARLLFMGLVDYDANLKIVPRVAKSWEISRDGRTYTFHLRTDSTFTNGEQVTAEDFAFAARRWVDPDLASPSSFDVPITGWNEARMAPATGVVGDVSLPGVVAPAPDMLVIKLDSPYSLLLYDLAILLPVPAGELATAAEAKAFADLPIGNGPYRMAEPWKHNQSITLERNPTYFGDQGLADRIDFRIFADDVTPYRELEAGNLELASPPLSQIAQAKQEFGENFIQSPAAFLYFVGLPVQVKPFDNLKLRQAISLAIDREALTTRLLEGSALPADGFVPPTFSGAAPTPCPNAAYDPTRAKKLYAQSGGLPGDAVTAYYPAGQGLDELAKAIANDVRATLDVNLTFKKVEITQYATMLYGTMDGPFGMGWASGTPSAYGFIQPLFETGGPGNFGSFTNPEFDRLMDEARQATGSKAINAKLVEAQEVLCRELPVIPLGFPSSLTVHSDTIENVVVNGFGTTLLEQVAVVQD